MTRFRGSVSTSSLMRGTRIVLTSVRTPATVGVSDHFADIPSNLAPMAFSHDFPVHRWASRTLAPGAVGDAGAAHLAVRVAVMQSHFRFRGHCRGLTVHLTARSRTSAEYLTDFPIAPSSQIVGPSSESSSARIAAFVSRASSRSRAAEGGSG